MMGCGCSPLWRTKILLRACLQRQGTDQLHGAIAQRNKKKCSYKYILFFINLQKLMVPRELADWPKVRREREASGTAEAPVVVAQIQPMSP